MRIVAMVRDVRKLFALALIWLGACAIAPAQASVTYLFNPTMGAPHMFLTVTDAAYFSGGLSFSVTGDCTQSAPSCSGDRSGWISLGFAGPYAQTFTNGALHNNGSVHVSVSFGPNGTLMGTIAALGLDEDVEISGGPGTWSGVYNYDISSCDAVHDANGWECAVSGTFLATSLPVPEPGSIWLMAGGVLGLFGALAWFRCRTPSLLGADWT